jgi:hypothetical protein
MPPPKLTLKERLLKHLRAGDPTIGLDLSEQQLSYLINFIKTEIYAARRDTA